MFMESKELRLGNYILLSKNHTFVETTASVGSKCKVEFIKSDTVGIACVMANCTCYGEIPISKLSPILLTEELLLKCGFEKKQAGSTMTYHYSLIELDMHFCLKVINGNIQIKYFHQLQNIYLALTGCELEVRF